jgi:hypothetical protein
MNDDELEPEVVAALRDVAPASEALRNQHIAAALAESAPASSRSLVKWLGAAAAVIVLLVGGNALYASLSPSTDSNVTPQPGTSTTVPVKGSACGASLTGYAIVGTYSSEGSVREVWSSKQDLVVADQTSCELLGTFTDPDVVANDKVCEGFFTSFAPEGVQWVGAYSVAGSELVLVATPTELQIRDGSCAVIASYPLPTGP